jgi:hypothetical protein
LGLPFWRFRKNLSRGVCDFFVVPKLPLDVI